MPTTPSKFTNVTINAFFDHYALAPFDNHGQTDYDPKIVFTNAIDETNHVNINKLTFNLTSCFKRFGYITSKLPVKIACRYYPETNTYSYPSRVNFDLNLQPFPNDRRSTIKMIQNRQN